MKITDSLIDNSGKRVTDPPTAGIKFLQFSILDINEGFRLIFLQDIRWIILRLDTQRCSKLK